MTAWPRKPPKDAKCDASTGSGSDSMNMPVIHRCRNAAVETVKTGGFEMWVCASCVGPLEVTGQIVRNPKRALSNDSATSKESE